MGGAESCGIQFLSDNCMLGRLFNNPASLQKVHLSQWSLAAFGYFYVLSRSNLRLQLIGGGRKHQDDIPMVLYATFCKSTFG